MASLTLLGAAVGRPPDLVGHADRRRARPAGYWAVPTGSLAGGRADDGALAALRRLDEVGVAASRAGVFLIAFLPGARRRRLGASSPASPTANWFQRARHSWSRAISDRRPRQRPAPVRSPCSRSASASSSGFTFDTRRPRAGRAWRPSSTRTGAVEAPAAALPEPSQSSEARAGDSARPRDAAPAGGDTEREMGVLAEAPTARHRAPARGTARPFSRPSAERLSARARRRLLAAPRRGARPASAGALPARLVLAVEPDVQEDRAGRDHAATMKDVAFEMPIPSMNSQSIRPRKNAQTEEPIPWSMLGGRRCTARSYPPARRAAQHDRRRLRDEAEPRVHGAHRRVHLVVVGADPLEAGLVRPGAPARA